jgi:hypothetical protein
VADIYAAAGVNRVNPKNALGQDKADRAISL